MATVNTIEKHIASLDEAQRVAAYELIGYVKRLASMTNTNIIRWDILRLFSNEQGVLVNDKKEINKRFFDKLERLANKKNEDELTTDAIPGLEVALEKNLKANFEAIVEQAKYDIREKTGELKNHNQRINTCLKKIADARRRLASLEGKNPGDSIKKEINEVLKEGLWGNPIVKGNFLYLNTTSNIVLTHINRNANINVQMDVGQFAVKINLEDFSMSVIPYKNNFMDTGEDGGSWGDGLWHPHVDQEGVICWGNAADTASEAIADQKLAKALKLLYAILTTYNDANPYVSLIDFQASNSKIVFDGAAMEFDYLIHPEHLEKLKDKPVKNFVDKCGCGDPNCDVNKR